MGDHTIIVYRRVKDFNEVERAYREVSYVKIYFGILFCVKQDNLKQKACFCRFFYVRMIIVIIGDKRLTAF